MASGGDLSAAAAPLVLTLQLDGGSFAKLNTLRRRYYPPERNLVPAHLTLFHQLPGERAREVRALLALVAKSQRRIGIAPGELREMGRGVALFLRSPQLAALRDQLAREWGPWLTQQDQAGFQPHVTIQNGVAAPQARQTLRELQGELGRLTVEGTGLQLWRYLGGPWQDLAVFRFQA